MTFNAVSSDKTQKIGILTILLVGGLLRLWQYSANSSLWLDEASLARNVLDRSPRELLNPLSYGQVAPVGFLLIQKAMVHLGGPSEYTLRALPLACGMASLLLFPLMAREALRGRALTYAVLLFALAQPFVYFSSQAKQYAPDVAASLLAVLMAVRIADGRLPRWEIFGLAAAGMLIPWISTSAALVLTGAAAGAVLPAFYRRDHVALRLGLPLLAAWGASGLAAGLLATRGVSPESREFLDWYWRTGYVPRAPWEQVGWGWETLTDTFGGFNAFRTNGGLGYAWPQLFAATTLLGFVQLARTLRALAAIFLGPLILVLAASLLRLYPASGRLLVFIIPLLLIATAAGAELLWTWFGRRVRIVGVAVVILFVAIPIRAAIETRPPYLIQPLRPVLERVEGIRHPGDAVYVDYAAAQAFLYYAPRFGFEAGDYVIGRCSLSDRRDYLRQVDRFRGEPRLWIIGTHLSAVERSLTVGYLEAIGRRIESVFVPPAGAPLRFAAYARLYDLSDPRRLARSSAATHRFQEAPLDEAAKRWGCFGPAMPDE